MYAFGNVIHHCFGSIQTRNVLLCTIPLLDHTCLHFKCTDLFPYDENASAVVARVSKEEFLLNAPGDLGMFVTSAGVSERPPIQWSKPALKFVFCQPYVVAMSDDSIVVYR